MTEAEVRVNPDDVIGCEIRFCRNVPFEDKVTLKIRVWDGNAISGIDRIVEVKWPLIVDRERVLILMDMAKEEIMHYLEVKP